MGTKISLTLIQYQQACFSYLLIFHESPAE